VKLRVYPAKFAGAIVKLIPDMKKNSPTLTVKVPLSLANTFYFLTSFSVENKLGAFEPLTPGAPIDSSAPRLTR